MRSRNAIQSLKLGHISDCSVICRRGRESEWDYRDCGPSIPGVGEFGCCKIDVGSRVRTHRFANNFAVRRFECASRVFRSWPNVAWVCHAAVVVADAKWAHSRNECGDRQTVREHLESTASLARGFGEAFDGAAMAYAAGLWHDLGKYSCAWQDRLALLEVGHSAQHVDHKGAGTRLAASQHLIPAALAIVGHHGGLRSIADLKDVAAADGHDDQAVLANARADCIETTLGATLPDHAHDPIGLETFTRFVFSALVDADSLDTAQHFGQQPTAALTDIADLAQRFAERRADAFAGRAASNVDDVRKAVLASSINAAATKPGMFRLAVPTGGGKTISAMSFALEHCRAHQLDRVIVAVPYISITQQTASVYRSLLNSDDDVADVVLEHHSRVGDTADSFVRQLAVENWDSRVVVTTTVQLFKSLFASKRSSMRKVHRLARSVIVLDEVQALPLNMLVPILDMLKRLVDNYGATVVLSTATQPEFWALREFESLEVTDIAPPVRDLSEQLRRVRFTWRTNPQPSLADVGAELAAQSQVLAIVNTTGDAATLATELTEAGAEALHLSSRLCPAHRQWVINEVRRRLASGADVRLVATQLVEAGVDFDFPTVWRALAPADSMLQAAGRANREGRGEILGEVVLFDPADGHCPAGSYRTARDQAKLLFGPGKADPDDLAVLATYYRELYERLRVADDRAGVQEARHAVDFETAAKRFTMIDDGTVAVVVAPAVESMAAEWIDPHRLDEALAVLARLERADPTVATRDFRLLQSYSVDLMPRSALARSGSMAELRPDLYIWNGKYDPLLGLVADYAAEEYVL